jgi:pyruvate dehydrogenase E2 component (dihydrolipoamide acetyltransferase)
LIGVIAKPDEDISSLLAAQPVPEAPPQKSSAAAAPVPVPPAETPAGARARGGRVKASPLARRLARERHISLETVPGSGPGGRVIKRDIEAFASGTVPATPPPTSAQVGPPLPSVLAGQELPLSGMRRTIARRLVESKFVAPHFYVTVEVDMDAAVALRQQMVRGVGTKVSVNDLVVRACALALVRFPTVNASWGEDKIVTHRDVHVGVAVALPDGLMTPVVKHADLKPVTEISTEIKALAARARERKLRPEEYTGSTFTVSNLGMFDVTEFTAIINPPESAILAVGSVRKVPVVDGDAIRVGQRMNVTLSSDHRVVDGALAARFLAETRRLLENPIALFV